MVGQKLLIARFGFYLYITYFWFYLLYTYSAHHKATYLNEAYVTFRL